MEKNLPKFYKIIFKNIEAYRELKGRILLIHDVDFNKISKNHMEKRQENFNEQQSLNVHILLLNNCTKI